VIVATSVGERMLNIYIYLHWISQQLIEKMSFPQLGNSALGVPKLGKVSPVAGVA
jgi:hypothetical protein